VKGKKTGGRKRGSRNKRSVELEKAAGGQLPLDYMLEVMRNEKADSERRDDMAKAAAPFLHARRAPEDKHGQTGPIGVWRIDAYEPKKSNGES
jgi:hypothetical protein